MKPRALRKKVKIAYVLTPIDFGGAEKVSLNFLKNYDNKILEIHSILLTRPWEDTVCFITELEKYGINYQTIPVAVRPRSEGRDVLRILRCLKRLLAILKKDQYDIIHTHGYFANIIGMIASKIVHVPVVSTCHGFIHNDWKLKVYNLIDCFCLRFSRKIIAVSDTVKQFLVQSGIDSSRITVIENAVEIRHDVTFSIKNRSTVRKKMQLSDPGRDFIIGYVGRLSREKGLEYLVKAIAQVSEITSAIRLVIIGEGPERENLQQLCRSLGLEEDIIFAGFKNDVEEWLPAFDVVVLPSLTEGMPMAVLESMANGIPVIASNVGGLPNLIDTNINGILVPAGNAEALSDALLSLMNDKSLRASIAAASLETIRQKYGMDNWVKEIEEVYLYISDTRAAAYQSK